MEKVIIVRYSEIHLKGNNRGFFENCLLRNITRAIEDYSAVCTRMGSRYVVRFTDNCEELVESLRCVFGVHSLSVAYEVKTSLDGIYEAAKAVCVKWGSFKVETNRADKTFFMNSIEVSAHIGGLLMKEFSLEVDVKTPQNIVCIDMREQGNTFVYSEVIKAVGGIPSGCSGLGVALLSGGIDSPVACYRMAKRGMTIHALHFHSFPYTGRQAIEKVKDLAKILKKYIPTVKLEMISVADIQLAINKSCPEELAIILLRRFMMRIACRVAQRVNASALITGESLGQVASQTLESINATNAVAQIPVFRPLIGYDKEEIVNIAKDINTFETSIRPFEDCCTLFLPKNPATKPRLKFVERAEASLDIAALIDSALLTSETVEI